MARSWPGEAAHIGEVGRQRGLVAGSKWRRFLGKTGGGVEEWAAVVGDMGKRAERRGARTGNAATWGGAAMAVVGGRKGMNLTGAAGPTYRRGKEIGRPERKGKQAEDKGGKDWVGSKTTQSEEGRS